MRGAIFLNRKREFAGHIISKCDRRITPADALWFCQFSKHCGFILWFSLPWSSARYNCNAKWREYCINNISGKTSDIIWLLYRQPVSVIPRRTLFASHAGNLGRIRRIYLQTTAYAFPPKIRCRSPEGRLPCEDLAILSLGQCKFDASCSGYSCSQ